MTCKRCEELEKIREYAHSSEGKAKWYLFRLLEIIQEREARIELSKNKQWCAYCGAWGAHTSGGCELLKAHKTITKLSNRLKLAEKVIEAAKGCHYQGQFGSEPLWYAIKDYDARDQAKEKDNV